MSDWRVGRMASMPIRRGPEAISPTAHYTGYVWARNGLSPSALATVEGRVLYHAVEPVMMASRLLGRPTVEGPLLARHRIIDELLNGAIDRQEIGQVIEVAAGLSPRGWRFAQRYGDALTYVETDLPGMAARKRRLLQRLDGTGPHHRVVELDALRDDGPQSLAALARTLDPGVGTAIITEGLLNYFAPQAVAGMWRRFAHALGGFPRGVYLADLLLEPRIDALQYRIAAGLLAVFVRGRIHFHFADRAEAQAALRDAGFASAELHRAEEFPTAELSDDPGVDLINIVEARTVRG
jgi:O-methyltransferase involved in polyketide biosynthesis